MAEINAIKLVLKDLENLEDLLHYYSDKNNAFETVIQKANEISRLPKHRKLCNTKKNRLRIANLAKKVMESRVRLEKDNF